MATDNHGLSKPPRGVTGWDTDWYQNFDTLDTLSEIRDEEANRQSYVAKEGAKYYSTDTHNIYLGTGGSGWVRVQSAGPNPTFEDVDADSLTVSEITTDEIDASNYLSLPEYDSLDDAPSLNSSMVYATGVDDTRGVYYYAGGEYRPLTGGDGSGGGGDSGISALSELTIDTSKNWRGYDISNVGQLTADIADVDDLGAVSATVASVPTSASDVVRLTDLSNFAESPHGNEAHSESYITEDDLADLPSGDGAPSPHGNDHHSETFATTADLDSRAEDPHGNEAHSPNFAETSHRHDGHTLRPGAVETGGLTTNSLTLGSAGPIEGLSDSVYVDSENRLAAVSGGSGGATGKSHVNFVDIDDYGADPSGQTYSDGALDDAISALSDGDWLVMTQGEYAFQNDHTITNDYITVTGEGSRITNEFDDAGGSSAMLRFLGNISSTTTPDTYNASAIQQGDQVVTVENASDFSPGDDILILERKDGASPHTGYNRSVAQTRSIVREVDGNDIYLTRSSSYFHGTGNAGVWSIDACKRPRVIDMHMRSGAGEKFLTFRFTRNGHMERCYAQNCTGFAYQMQYGFRDTMVDCVSKHPTYAEDRGASQQEHMRFIGGTDPVLVNPVVEDARRAIDINNGMEGLKVINPLITNAQLHGICFHSRNESETVYGSYEIYGGRIEAKQQRVTNGLVHSGYAASLSPNQNHVKIIGTTLVGRAAHLNSPYSDGNTDNVTLIGCTFESVPDYSGGHGIRIGGSNWTIEGCTIRTNSGQDAIISDGGSMSSVRIINNHIEGNVDLSDATIDGYWFKNNYWDGTGSAPSGTDHFTSDNT